MNELNVGTISDSTDYVSSYGLPKVQINALVAIYESALKSLPYKPMPLVNDHRKQKNTYLYRYGETRINNLNNSFYISKFCCISEQEGEKILKVSVHENGLL